MRNNLNVKLAVATLLLLVSIVGFVVSIVTLKQNRVNHGNYKGDTKYMIGDDDDEYYSLTSSNVRKHEEDNFDTEELKSFFIACFGCGIVSTVSLSLFISTIYKGVYDKKVNIK